MAKVETRSRGGGGAICPRGVWPATVKSAEDQASKAERRDAEYEGRDVRVNMVVIEFAVTAGQVTYNITCWVSFRWESGFRAMGAAWPHTLAGGEVDTDLIRPGDACLVEIAHELYEGETKAKVDKILPRAPGDSGDDRAAYEDDECPF